MINYIETQHEYSDENGEYGGIYYAVCPSPHTYAFPGNEKTFAFSTKWQLMGSTLYVHGQQDIDGLRKLLDKIEEQLMSTK